MCRERRDSSRGIRSCFLFRRNYSCAELFRHRLEVEHWLAPLTGEESLPLRGHKEQHQRQNGIQVLKSRDAHDLRNSGHH